MIFDVDRKALVRWIEARALGDRPALERAVQLQAEIVVQPPCSVLLDQVGMARGSLGSIARGLRRFGEVTLGAVLGKLAGGHGTSGRSPAAMRGRCGSRASVQTLFEVHP